MEQIPKTGPSTDRGLQRPLEDGIASNRGSAHHGEYVLESCTRVAMRSKYLVGESPALLAVGRKPNPSLIPVRGQVKGENRSRKFIAFGGVSRHVDV